jgi:hypothetical protein
MNSTKIKLNLYDFLIDNTLVHVKIDKSFRDLIYKRLIEKFSSLKKYHAGRFRVTYGALKHEFSINTYFKLHRLLKIANDIDIPKEDVFNHIISFFARGSKTNKEIIIPKELTIDEVFVECFALYLAEGDNGSNGNTIPRKVRLTNSEFVVLKLFMEWLNQYFPNNPYYLRVLIPYTHNFTEEDYNEIKKYFNLKDEQISKKVCKWKRRTQMVYRVCLDSAVLIDLLLGMKSIIKGMCSNNKKLAAAYIRGMMIGEGTAYFNKSRYVRIEMRNEEEIKYLHQLFTLLGFDCKPSLRTERYNMWSLYIGAKQLKRYNDLIGLGIHEKRQAILERAVNKKLRVNQYC